MKLEDFLRSLFTWWYSVGL